MKYGLTLFYTRLIKHTVESFRTWASDWSLSRQMSPYRIKVFICDLIRIVWSVNMTVRVTFPKTSLGECDVAFFWPGPKPCNGRPTYRRKCWIAGSAHTLFCFSGFACQREDTGTLIFAWSRLRWRLGVLHFATLSIQSNTYPPDSLIQILTPSNKFSITFRFLDKWEWAHCETNKVLWVSFVYSYPLNAGKKR